MSVFNVNSTRRPVKALTSVPEQERSIKHRLEIVLVGTGAENFAQRAVHSEEAEAYVPKATDLGASGHDLTVFCPCEESEGSLLARIRFKTVEGFSQSLPSFKNEDVPNILIVFLVWNTEQNVDDRLTDFQRRVAELNNMPRKRRPCITLFAFKVDNAEEKAIKDFSSKWTCLTIDPIFYGSNDDDTIMEAVRDMSDKIIAVKRRRISTSFYPSMTQKSSICTIL